MIVTVAIVKGESIPGTGSAGGVEAELVIFRADEVRIEEIVKVAACASGSIRGEDVTVDVTVLDEFGAGST